MEAVKVSIKYDFIWLSEISCHGKYTAKKQNFPGCSKKMTLSRRVTLTAGSGKNRTWSVPANHRLKKG